MCTFIARFFGAGLGMELTALPMVAKPWTLELTYYIHHRVHSFHRQREDGVLQTPGGRKLSRETASYSTQRKLAFCISNQSSTRHVHCQK